MRKGVICFLAILLAVSAFGQSAAQAASTGEDTIIDKAGDWMATMGKSPEDRDAILTERKADRVAKRLRKAIDDSAKKAGNEMEKIGKKMGNMLEE